MPGSPRVERAANIRIQHPNLSTEDAMKLAGYNVDEAKDPKRQSNVRQKTHRLTKGRKRPSNAGILPSPDHKRPLLGLEAESHGGPSHGGPGGVNDQGGASDYFPLPIDYGPAYEKVENIASVEPHSHYETPQRPSSGPGRPLSELHRAPGSARAEKAARFWLDNPNLSIENAMKLAGFAETDVKDKYKQNDIRQTAHQLTVQIAAKASKGTSTVMSSELRGRLTAIDRKIDEMANRLERTVDIKLQELGARIDDKFNYVHQQLHMMGGSGTTSASNYGHHQGSSQLQQQPHPQQQFPFQHTGNHPQMQQQQQQPQPQPQGYLPSSHPAGGSVQGGTLYGHGRPPSMYPQQRHDSIVRTQDGKQRHMDSTVAL
jgi:hypothetical protein